MLSKPSRPHQGKSAEQRIAERRKILIDTAFQFIKSKQWRDVSINRLCQQAGLNKRYFYESFAQLDHVVDAVYDTLQQDLITHVVAAIQAAYHAQVSKQTFAEQVLGSVVDFLTQDAEYLRILFTDFSDSPALIKSRQRVMQQCIHALSEYAFLHYQTQKTHEPLVQLTASLLIGGTIQILQDWLNGQLELSKKALIAELALLWRLNGDAVHHVAMHRQSNPP